MEVNFNLMLDLPPGVTELWQPLITATGDLELYKQKYDGYEKEDAIFFLAFDQDNPNSILNSVRRARENSRIVRENISKESWEAINGLYHFVNDAHGGKTWNSDKPQHFFSAVKQKVELIYGISFNTDIRGDGWNFNRIGQYLERADKTSRILDVKYHILLPSVSDVGSPLDALHWAALLKSVSGYNSYRRYYGKLNPVTAVEYLILASLFPRSIYFCLNHAENSLRQISGNSSGKHTPVEKTIGNLRADLEFADINDIFEFGLHEYLDKIQVQLNKVSEQVSEQYFQIRPNFTQQISNQ